MLFTKFATMTDRKGNLILISNVQADNIFAGGAIIRKILDILPQDLAIKWFYPQIGTAKQEYLSSLTTRGIKLYPKQNKVYDQPLADWVKRYIRPSIAWRMRIAGQKSYLKQWVKAWANEIIKEVGPDDVLWIVMQNESVYLAEILLRQVPNKVHLTFHDDCRFDFFDPDNFGINTEALRYVISRATSADVIGHNLRAEFKSTFDLESFIFRRGFAPSSIQVLAPQPKDTYQLLFVGSSHSDKSWQVALGQLQKLSPLKFRIHCFGHTGSWLPGVDAWRASSSIDNVTFVDGGVVPEAQLMARKHEFDFAIFLWDHFEFKSAWMKFSVSTKLTTYLGAGLPMVALISPDNEAHNMFGAGVGYDLYQASAETFNSFVETPDMQAKFDAYINHAFNEVAFNHDFLHAKAFESLGLD